MRTLFSYILVICLALSSLTGSVAYAYDALPSASHELNQHQPIPEQLTSVACHSMNPATVLSEINTDKHDCCGKSQHDSSATCDSATCDKGCCAAHCAVAGVLLNTHLFSYIPATTVSNEYLLTLPNWLFFKDPPPPIIA